MGSLAFELSHDQARWNIKPYFFVVCLGDLPGDPRRNRLFASVNISNILSGIAKGIPMPGPGAPFKAVLDLGQFFIVCSHFFVRNR